MTSTTKMMRCPAILVLALWTMLTGMAQAQVVVYYHTDALGSPVAITDASGNVLERTEYEPYGQVLNPPVKDGPGYAGHVSDAQTGLSYMQQRYYDPQIGRFLSIDPVTANANAGGNFNRYWYANNNPYRYTDPDGRCTEGQECHEPVPWNRYRDTGIGRFLSASIGNMLAVFSHDRINPLSGDQANADDLDAGRIGLVSLMMPSARGAGFISGPSETALAEKAAARLAERVIDPDGSLRTSRTVAEELAGQRNYIPTQAITETIRGGIRVADPQGVANQFMYTSKVSWTVGKKSSSGTLEVLVNEDIDYVYHVLYRSE